MEGNETIAKRVERLMPELRSDLERLARIPSIASPGHSKEPVLKAHGLIVELLRAAGVLRIGTLELPDASPVVIGEIPAPTGAPTVLLYAHCDLQPPGDEKSWRTPPFEPAESDGAIYARGIADDRSNVIVHLGALRAFGGRPPVGIKIVFEGQEEYRSPMDHHPPRRPELFRADAMVIADMGNLRQGVPTLTVALRGDTEAIVEVRVLKEPRHRGEFGGPAPDALIVLVHALATLHDERGDVAVPGLRRESWLGERLWSGPALQVVGIDVPSAHEAVKALVPYARATLNLRIHPEQDAREAQAALVRHLDGVRPFGIPLWVQPGAVGQGFAARTAGPAYEAARVAMQTAWGADPAEAASGGSIPLVDALHEAVPDAEILLFGGEDAESNLLPPNERVLLDELEKSVVAEAEFFREYAARDSKPGGQRWIRTSNKPAA